VQLSSLAGKTVLINFWATWCGLCVKEIPDLVELHCRHPDLVILGVAVDANPHDDDDEPKGTDGPEARIRRIASEKHINYPILIDHDAQAMAPYAGGDLPVTILVDAQGMVRRRMISPRSVEVWEKLVDDLSTPSTTAMATAGIARN
jgi:thiol-disulfide isomerase/thioredoxin